MFVAKPPAPRFWRKVDPCRADGCMVWVGTTRANGYGQFSVGGRNIRAHQFLQGKAPAGLQWDHLCRNRLCVNPDHLEVVTPRENSLRGMGASGLNARKTHCPQGHPYDLFNTYFRTDGGARVCRVCQQNQIRRYRAKKAATVAPAKGR